MQVGTLINNVGLSYDHPDYLTTLDDTFIRQIIEINCLATTKVGSRLNILAGPPQPGQKQSHFWLVLCSCAVMESCLSDVP